MEGPDFESDERQGSGNPWGMTTRKSQPAKTMIEDTDIQSPTDSPTGLPASSALGNLPNCRNCTHCGPSVGVHGKSGITVIRCNHPDWGDEDTEMREIDPTFGEMCADYSQENSDYPEQLSR